MIRDLVVRALFEDLGRGDVTADACVPPDLHGRASLVARQRLVVCGLPIVVATFLEVDPRVQVELRVCDETTVRGDRHRLKQLLLNLTDNAIKYNQPDGRIAIALRRNNGAAELTIANTGPGLAPEKLPRVFDRFYRGDPAHGSDIEGTGLGLSIAQWIVKAHGGTIQLVSDPGKLTTVTVKFPAESQS